MYKKGNFYSETDRNGWIYGNFMPENDLAKDERAEIKIIRLDNSFTSKPHYNKTSTKLDIVFDGKAIWDVDGEEIEMSTGDYLIIPPKVKVCIKKIISESLTVQTIRIPSTPDDKVMA